MLFIAIPSHPKKMVTNGIAKIPHATIDDELLQISCIRATDIAPKAARVWSILKLRRKRSKKSRAIKRAAVTIVGVQI
jgi:hypothetical protein